MPKLQLELMGVDLSDIQNANKERVIKLFPKALEDFPGFKPDALDIQDIFALTLNRLPPRYKQKMSIVIVEPITDEEIVWEIGNAIRMVEENPTGKGGATIS